MYEIEQRNPFLNEAEVKRLKENIAEYKLALRQDPEVRRLVRSINEMDQIQLFEFGREPAEQISRLVDQMIHIIWTTRVEDAGELFKQLGAIMDKFERKDCERIFHRLFERWSNKKEKWIENLFQKYQTLGKEIDKIFVEIVKYQDEILQSTKKLEALYEQSYHYYLELEKYATAVQLKIEELQTTPLLQLEKRTVQGKETAVLQLNSLRTALELLEQRKHDLETAKIAVLQTAPQIRLLQRGNAKLIAKTNAAFVIAIPLFKNGLIQAVAAKQQKLISDSLNELERRTNEMFLRNAKNISQQSVNSARLSGCPSITIETIEESRKIIMKGIEELKALEEENKRLRETGRKQLEQLQERMRNK